MNQSAILQSNLLDIIFENRNKDYGAYTLRRSYSKRLSIALLSMVTSTLLLCLLLLNRSATVPNMHTTLIATPEIKTSDYDLFSKAKSKVAVNRILSKKANRLDLPPRIVDSININNFPATPIETTPSLISANSSGISYEPGGTGNGNISIKGLPAIDAELAESRINKHSPVYIAEIMPQYPGGKRALLDFLKKIFSRPGILRVKRYRLK